MYICLIKGQGKAGFKKGLLKNATTMYNLGTHLNQAGTGRIRIVNPFKSLSWKRCFLIFPDFSRQRR
jgi:hypothetical protein